MLNKQAPEKRNVDPRGLLEVQAIFLTIQGEGPYQGRPAIFIRLAGCNLQCPGCDTDYTSARSLVNPGAIVRYCQSLGKGQLVVITGGEPFRQSLTPLIKQLLVSGYEVQVETNGTIYDPNIPYNKVTVVCSPKTQRIHPKLPVDYYKYVLDAEHVSEEDGLPTSVLGMPHPPARPRPSDKGIRVYVQPADEQDEAKTTANLDAVKNVCFKYGYYVCIQLHKLLGLP